MRITAFGKTDRGRRRPNNEDDLAVVDLTEGRLVPDHSAEHLQVGEKGVLLAVCDGVGGRRAGEVASGLALEVLSGEMESLSPTCPKRDLFRAAVEKVNARVWKQAQSDSTLEGMATTLERLAAVESSHEPWPLEDPCLHLAAAGGQVEPRPGGGSDPEGQPPRGSINERPCGSANG